MTTQLAEITDLARAVLRNRDIELGMSTPFEELPLWDSMYLVALAVEVENAFGIVFEPDEIEGIDTPARLLCLIVEKRALVRG